MQISSSIWIAHEYCTGTELPCLACWQQHQMLQSSISHIEPELKDSSQPGCPQLIICKRKTKAQRAQPVKWQRAEFLIVCSSLIHERSGWLCAPGHRLIFHGFYDINEVLLLEDNCSWVSRVSACLGEVLSFVLNPVVLHLLPAFMTLWQSALLLRSTVKSQTLFSDTSTHSWRQ